jgi:3-oxoacyl-[acyl-carrier protein] reductase
MSSAHQPGFDDLAGRRVLVTGASSGIGAAVALAFGRCGAHVAVHYRSHHKRAADVRDAILATGGAAFTTQGDLSREEDRARVAQETVQHFGGLDVLINNAGAMLNRRTLDQSDDGFFSEIMDVNLRSVVGMTRLLAPTLGKSRGASIINTGSRAAMTGGGPGAMLYAASKGAVNTLTIGLARELGPQGIRVNTVSPGFIETPIHTGLMSPETREATRREIPLGRLGEPEDCVGAYLFLASEKLAGYVSGTTIHVTGGRL